MKYRILLRFVIVISFIYPAEDNFGQITLDHRVFLKEIGNSSNQIYGECLEEYDSYLKHHPDDIPVLIEKCRFIQLAQYDADMDYNPNQAVFDSCFASLITMYPKNPEVILYQIENSWGDELKEIFRTTELLIMGNPEDWTKANLGTFYYNISEQFYTDSDYQNASTYIQKAIDNDAEYGTSLLYAQILKETNRPDEALEVLISNKDSTGETWQLVQRANLLLELKAYSDATQMFSLIIRIDSNYNNNYELAQSLEGAGKYDLSRQYLLRDTAYNWSKETALKNLLIHDLKYHKGDTCIETYNEFRSIGYNVDPLALYRLKTFMANPYQPWKWRDLSGLFTLIGVIFLLLIIPSIWILPVYFVGNYWNFKNQKKSYDSVWGLKWFWIVSFAYLFASLIVGISDPDYFYSQFSSSYYQPEPGQETLGRVTLISMIVFGIIGLIGLYKKDLKILLSGNWSVIKSVFYGFGIVIAFKLISTVYIQIGIQGFGLSIEEITSIPNILFSSRQEIEALLSNYGYLIGVFLLCLFVPFYEEVVFRGIILDSCQKHINFNTANIIQAGLFGLVHLNLFLFPVFFMFGIITGVLRKKSQGLLSGMVFHSVNNALSIMILILT
jgi:uncharacterized protein